MKLSSECPIPLICSDIPEEYVPDSGQQTRFDQRYLNYMVELDKGSSVREKGAIAKCFNCNPNCALKRMYPDSEFKADDVNAPSKPSASNPYAGE